MAKGVMGSRRHRASREKLRGADPELSPGLRGERQTGWS
jgi:hypothetical protein